MTTMLSLLLFYIYLSLPTAYSASCAVSIKYGEFGTLQPLILTEDRGRFLYPEKNNGSVLEISSGKSIYLACPGDNNYIKNMPGVKEAEATCISGKTFSVNMKIREFSSLTCLISSSATTKSMLTTCLNKYSAMQIGFQLQHGFLQTIKLCHDKDTYVTHYSMYSLTRKHGNSQIGYPRPPKWRDENYFSGLDIGRLYNWNVQINVIGKILQSDDIAKAKINKDQFLSRGHLTAMSDFVYGSQKTATFSYLNVAPQWVSFNGGNWAILERGVQDFVRNRLLDLEVYTGVHGEMTMADKYGQQQKIHLGEFNTKTPLIVPKYFWKIIYDPQKKLGTAFVGLNDPFISLNDSTVYLCKDRIESKINWLNWKPTDIKKGVSYACPVNSLRKQIPTIPQFDVVGVLI
ncbi:uncharacterized protein LOC128885924 [Hylaeus anthracinus]|uniref:uncharacterized protein LOC128885924 n=1 Tax=Hylaeus anthracinus TaxID=313031 RepID=UPI0023B9E5A3|nr:uncharacterized protein LOC128885924 [Hylaeus anthracinus]